MREVKNMFERKELINFRKRVLENAMTEGLNPSWKLALLRLANALDHLDAMIARTQIN